MELADLPDTDIVRTETTSNATTNSLHTTGSSTFHTIGKAPMHAPRGVRARAPPAAIASDLATSADGYTFGGAGVDDDLTQNGDAAKEHEKTSPREYKDKT